MRVLNVSIDKSSSPSSVTIGQEINYTITIANNSKDDATGVTVTENIPPGLCVTGITAPSSTYVTYGNPTITWNIGDLAAGDSTMLTFTAIPQVAGSITNTATVSGTDFPDKSGSATTEVKPSADLAIYKYSCSNQAAVGEPLTYFITVINNGPSTATGVTVVDTFLNAAIQSLAPSQGSCPLPPYGSTATCTLGTILPQGVAQIKLTAAPTAAGSVQNTAKVSSDVFDPNMNNNTANQNITVAAAADIGITKTVTPAVTVIGGQVTYTVTVTNYGPSPATNVKIEDMLPPGLNIDPSTVQPPCSITGNKVICTIPELGVGDSEEFTLVGNVVTPGVLNNSVVIVTADQIDPNPCNNASSASVFAGSVAGTDLSIEKTHSPEPVLVCTPLTYTITVTNNGPAVATGVILVDQLPSTVDILSINASQGECCYPWKGCCPSDKDCCSPAHSCSSCSQHCQSASECYKPNQVCQSKREIVCELGSLAVGSSAVVEIIVRPKTSGPLVNTALVSANQSDTVPGNNQVSNTSQVITPMEQIGILTKTINGLVTDGILNLQDADLLIDDIIKAEWGLECGTIRDAESALNSLMQRTYYLISQNALPRDIGCSLAKTGALLIEHLKCPCGDS